MPINPALLEDIIFRLLVARGSDAQLFEVDILQLCIHARDALMSQPSLLKLQAPMKICGDIRGQYSDLIQLFECGGFPPEANYLFLGNYVDHGKQSIETISLLLAFKIKHPKNFFLLRGNHECDSIDLSYGSNGFFDDCKRRFSVHLWRVFIECFNCLPIAALIDDKILCMHGGLSPDLKNLDQIHNIVRPITVPNHGLLYDLLWSDPDKNIEGWGKNIRGVSCTFGPDRVSEFLWEHNMVLICRSHQVVENGYEFFAGNQLVTIFSAPNYCGEFSNACAIMVVDENSSCSIEILKQYDNKEKVIGSGMSSHGTPPSKEMIDIYRPHKSESTIADGPREYLKDVDHNDQMDKASKIGESGTQDALLEDPTLQDTTDDATSTLQDIIDNEPTSIDQVDNNIIMDDLPIDANQSVDGQRKKQRTL